MAHREPWIGREDRTNWPGIKDTTKGDWREHGFMEPFALFRNRLGLATASFRNAASGIGSAFGRVRLLPRDS
jgi:hypothetical protein